jgi:hypothetical protein
MDEIVRCPCNLPVEEFLWVVKNVWYCSEKCGYKAAYALATQTTQSLRPTSQAQYPGAPALS